MSTCEASDGRQNGYNKNHRNSINHYAFGGGHRFFFDFKAVCSALVGGGISILATALFSYAVFSPKPGAPARHIAKAFYIAEIMKILLTGVLFAAVLLWLDVSFIFLFLTYGVTLLAYWLALPLTLADSSRTP
jgi:ATP synthase protein I